MKFPYLVATVVFSTLTSAFAITGADITPAALAGKTLVFDILNGGPPYADKGGSWSMTFSATGTSFTADNITGNTVPVPSTSCTGTSDSSGTTFTLTKFIEGQNAATLFLYTTETGGGGYELFIEGVNGVSLNGPFTIGAPPVPKAPEIDVLLSGGKTLADGKYTRNFGTVKNKASVTRSFTIKNSGTAPLKNISFSVSGKNKSNFTVISPKITKLAPDATLTFKVKFKPTRLGIKNAALHITSSDANESPFDIKLSGTSVQKVVAP